MAAMGVTDTSNVRVRDKRKPNCSFFPPKAKSWSWFFPGWSREQRRLVHLGHSVIVVRLSVDDDSCTFFGCRGVGRPLWRSILLEDFREGWVLRLRNQIHYEFQHEDGHEGDNLELNLEGVEKEVIGFFAEREAEVCETGVPLPDVTLGDPVPAPSDVRNPLCVVLVGVWRGLRTRKTGGGQVLMLTSVATDVKRRGKQACLREEIVEKKIVVWRILQHWRIDPCPLIAGMRAVVLAMTLEERMSGHLDGVLKIKRRILEVKKEMILRRKMVTLKNKALH
ncbi:uncharacterized protein HKW66_Vig0038810 [Vigna angularis]|uniref:Uncharacterized protein n=1 Tax=Phaseolus angularis TaxID=3914 RepID=A0A8T0LAD2_PHAAN|nr:uncharacterized protein HKW66_Vig0038810 [Vigna angularis]